MNKAWKAASLVVDTNTDLSASLKAVAVLSRASSDNGCAVVQNDGQWAYSVGMVND